MAKGDYFFPLYYQKLLTSTTGWKDDEFGAYVKLLIYQYDKGSIPADMETIVRIAPSAKKNWALLSKKFKAIEDGQLINERMHEIRGKRILKGERLSKNGKKGGRPSLASTSEVRIYLIKCYNDAEEFLKIGLTQETIIRRFDSSMGRNSKLPYKYSVLLDMVIDYDMGFLIEQKILSSFEKYLPKIQFGGHLECLKIGEGSSEKIIELITKIKANGFQKESNNSIINGYLYLGEEGSREETFLPTGIIPALIADFKKVFPLYPYNQAKDFPAIKSLVAQIGEAMGFSYEESFNQKSTEVRQKWNELLEFISTDKWYSKRSLTDLKEEWQRLYQGFTQQKPKIILESAPKLSSQELRTREINKELYGPDKPK